MKLYVKAASKKDDAAHRGALGAPLKERGPDIMIHMTAPSFLGGTVLTPHLAPHKGSLNGARYKKTFWRMTSYRSFGRL